MGRTHGDKIDKEGTNKLLDDAEEWSWGAPDGGFPEADYTSKLAELREQVTGLNGAYFEAVKKDHEEMQARMVSSDLVAAGRIIPLRSSPGYSRFQPSRSPRRVFAEATPSLQRFGFLGGPLLISFGMLCRRLRRSREGGRRRNEKQTGSRTTTTLGMLLPCSVL